jgi:hypothetical protein
MCRLFWNLGASTSWNPHGLSRPVMGLLYLLTFYLFRSRNHISAEISVGFLIFISKGLFVWDWTDSGVCVCVCVYLAKNRRLHQSVLSVRVVAHHCQAAYYYSQNLSHNKFVYWRGSTQWLWLASTYICTFFPSGRVNHARNSCLEYSPDSYIWLQVTGLGFMMSRDK